MQLIHTFPHPGLLSGAGIRVLLLSGEADPIARKLEALGAEVQARDELYTALADILDDPQDAGLFVMDCDTIEAEGVEGARRALRILSETRRHIPVILISRAFQRQSFPEDRFQPVELRAPLSAVSLKVGFEHALRDRLDVACA
ncbi:hypothetical protein [Stagnihabitans tardus]|uniref:Uncharacterized protein n=1 Tax=Stagnihabitans tardus TaxID=2699202 RepID=A0AAE5BUE9_9RHOB|nr:hypothetical protein [Stagnihabitans tardus]NBZ87157.1 hypothetical protein [Stagnihabitans tardus]